MGGLLRIFCGRALGLEPPGPWAEDQLPLPPCPPELVQRSFNVGLLGLDVAECLHR